MKLIIVRKHGKSFEDIAEALIIEIDKIEQKWLRNYHVDIILVVPLNRKDVKSLKKNLTKTNAEDFTKQWFLENHIDDG